MRSCEKAAACLQVCGLGPWAAMPAELGGMQSWWHKRCKYQLVLLDRMSSRRWGWTSAPPCVCENVRKGETQQSIMQHIRRCFQRWRCAELMTVLSNVRNATRQLECASAELSVWVHTLTPCMQLQAAQLSPIIEAPAPAPAPTSRPAPLSAPRQPCIYACCPRQLLNSQVQPFLSCSSMELQLSSNINGAERP